MEPMQNPTATAGVIDSHALEVDRGERFEFGKNWSNFLRLLDEDRIERAVNSLKGLLGVSNLQGATFLDIGSGSGLFSLAAHRLGARVRSFDYDANSVACTTELRRRYAAGTSDWLVERGSVLDKAYLASLGQFDYVYSWGVLHHTGSMWEAIENAASLVAPGGVFAIAIYNDQGAWSKRWTVLKKFYCSGPFGKAVMCATYIPGVVAWQLARDLFWLRNPFKWYTDYRKSRGMSVFYDWFDWLGGYPFEVAKPEVIFKFARDRGFEMTNFTTCGGSVGCNEFVFRRISTPVV
jgi:2-polyprenyl-6-hydroxyphenyl methylase/3-demethylubiquinone-9 3-methyltransferase